MRGVRWEEEGENKCLAIITWQVRYDLYNNTRAGDSCFTTELTTYNTAYVVQYTILAVPRPSSSGVHGNQRISIRQRERRGGPHCYSVD